MPSEQGEIAIVLAAKGGKENNPLTWSYKLLTNGGQIAGIKPHSNAALRTPESENLAGFLRGNEKTGTRAG
jgi:hypothetical protein